MEVGRVTEGENLRAPVRQRQNTERAVRGVIDVFTVTAVQEDGQEGTGAGIR